MPTIIARTSRTSTVSPPNVDKPKKFPHVVKDVIVKHPKHGSHSTITKRTETHVTFVGPEPLPGWKPRKRGQKPAMRQGVVRTLPVEKFMREFGVPARPPVTAKPAAKIAPKTAEPAIAHVEHAAAPAAAPAVAPAVTVAAAEPEPEPEPEPEHPHADPAHEA
jgi:hypothetical protein